MANFQRVIDLWLKGYTITDIARKIRISRSTIELALREKRLVLPERDWGGPGVAGIHHVTARHWVDRGLLSRSPSGLYSITELKKIKAELLGRQCKATNCTNTVDSISVRVIFCNDHRNIAKRLVS